jgi:hypothetical protein
MHEQVPGFEKAIDKTALAEEAAVRAEAAANRALLCLQAAEQYNQQSAAAREAQKKVEAEHAAIEDKVPRSYPFFALFCPTPFSLGFLLGFICRHVMPIL